jgi:thiol-disulfide isomerase/thioredoxin
MVKNLLTKTNILIVVSLLVVLLVVLNLNTIKNLLNFEKKQIENFSMLGKTPNTKYKIVYFYSSNCKFCHEFNKMWEEYTNKVKSDELLKDKIEFMKKNIDSPDVLNFIASSNSINEESFGVPEVIIFTNKIDPVTKVNEVAKISVVNNDGETTDTIEAIYSKRQARRNLVNLMNFTYTFTKEKLY